jgi:glycosyltransferase involved in cell wall biosynthesis
VIREAPIVSVILPVHNGEPYIALALDSILCQTHLDLELLVLDDGSTDASADAVRRFVAIDPRCQLFRHESRGLVASLNELIDRSRGLYLARMDADDLAMPERLTRQVEYLERHPEVVAVGSAVEFIDPDGDPLMAVQCPLSHEDIEATLFSYGSSSVAIAHPSSTIRADAARRVGGYRGDYWPAEDVDFFLRLGEVGRLANLPEVLLRYRVHDKSVSNSNRLRQSEAHRLAVQAARQRRDQSEVRALVPAASRAREESSRLRWVWWALRAGNVGTARKHAGLALRERPLDLETWRAWICARRGW